MECMLVMICILTGFSMSALLTLSVERFLGLKCPLILPSNCRHEKEARDFLRISCGYNSQPFLVAFHWKLNWLCRRNCVYFVVSAFVYMLKLQHVDDRQVKTEKPKYFNYARSWTSQKTNSKFEANFHLFDGCWLFFHLLFSSFIIFGFAIDRRHAFKRSTKPAISYLVVHCFRYELDVQLSNIFLENFNPTPRRNEDGKMLSVCKVLTECTMLQTNWGCKFCFGNLGTHLCQKFKEIYPCVSPHLFSWLSFLAYIHFDSSAASDS